jgi:methionyl-tRNA formyltransferase
MRVLFWGTPEFAIPAFHALGEEGHDIVAVVTQPDRPSGRGRALTMSPVKQAALAEGIPVIQPERARGDEFIARLRDLDVEMSVVVAFGQILPLDVLDVPPLGSVNIHASLLPELRGAAPVHWSIIRGLDHTGVTIMRMEAGLDSGPILYQVEEPIRPDESMAELSVRLSEIGAEALLETLAVIEVDGMVGEAQDASRASYAPKLDRETAHLDWSLPAREVARWIRGLDDVPGAWSLVNGGDAVKLFSPRVESAGGAPGEVLDADPERGILVAAGEDAVRVGQVQPPGRRRMTAGEWVRGRGVEAGARLS